MLRNQLVRVVALSLIGTYSPTALGCSSVEKFSWDDSRHVFVGRIVSHEATVYDGRSVLGLEVEPLHEFTPESQRLERNYVLYPTGRDSLCRSFYLGSQPYTDEQYRVGNLVTVYGSKLESTGLGDLSLGSHMVDPIHPACDDIEMTTVPSVEDGSMHCLASMFHVYRVLAMLPTASSIDIDRGLRWLSDHWYQLPYELIVEEYGEPGKATSYLDLRYGDVLNSSCEERPKISGAITDPKEKEADRLFRRRWFEYCDGRSDSK